MRTNKKVMKDFLGEQTMQFLKSAHDSVQISVHNGDIQTAVKWVRELKSVTTEVDVALMGAYMEDLKQRQEEQGYGKGD